MVIEQSRTDIKTFSLPKKGARNGTMANIVTTYSAKNNMAFGITLVTFSFRNNETDSK